MFLPRTIGILGGAFMYHHHHHHHPHHHHNYLHYHCHPHLYHHDITVMIQGIMEMMFSNFCRTEKSRKLFTLTSHHRANIQSSILLMIISFYICICMCIRLLVVFEHVFFKVRNVNVEILGSLRVRHVSHC